MSIVRQLVALLLLSPLAACQIFRGASTTGGTVTGGGNNPLVITTTTLPSGITGTSYSQTLTSTGGTAPLTWTLFAGSLPNSLSLSTAGVISGTPTVAGNFSFTVRLADSAAHATTQLLSIGINAPPTGADNRYCNTNGTWAAAATDGVANLPTACNYTAISNTPSPGATITVCPGGSCDFTTVQLAFDSLSGADCGKTISIKATDTGASSGVQLVYAKANIPNIVCDATHWITVKSSLTASLPPEGTRVAPCWVNRTLYGRPAPSNCPTVAGIYMPKMQVLTTCNPVPPATCQGQNAVASVLSTNGGSPAYWRFIGIEFEQVSGPRQRGGTVVDLEGGDNLILDRSIVHGGNDPAGQDKTATCKGVHIEGSHLSLIDSYVYNIPTTAAFSCSDSQAVYMGGTNSNANWNVIKVVNNFLESSGESFFTGGNAATVVPTDFEIRRNHTFHPLFWKTNCTPSRRECDGQNWYGQTWEVKNLGELKNASRVLIEANIFSNNWFGDADQKGTALLLTPKNQSAQPAGTPGLCPICSVNNVTVRYNFIEHATHGMGVAAVINSDTVAPGVPDSEYNIVIHDNVLDDISGTAWSSNPTGGCCVMGNVFGMGTDIDDTKYHDIYFDHNTASNFADPTITFGQAPSVTLLTATITAPFQPKFVGLTNNIAIAGVKGFRPSATRDPQCLGSTGGSAVNLNACFTNTWCMDGNVLPVQDAGGNVRPNTPYPGNTPYNPSVPSSGSPNCSRPLVGNQAPALMTDVGFVNYNNGIGGDYRLCTGVGVPAASCTGASPYLGASNDGRAPGADVTLVNQMTAGVQ